MNSLDESKQNPFCPQVEPRPSFPSSHRRLRESCHFDAPGHLHFTLQACQQMLIGGNCISLASHSLHCQSTHHGAQRCPSLARWRRRRCYTHADGQPTMCYIWHVYDMVSSQDQNLAKSQVVQAAQVVCWVPCFVYIAPLLFNRFSFSFFFFCSWSLFDRKVFKYSSRFWIQHQRHVLSHY